jgi:HD-GYP domain-containing protein (c-di-GMP phosphodiesterase class II)
MRKAAGMPAVPARTAPAVRSACRSVEPLQLPMFRNNPPLRTGRGNDVAGTQYGLKAFVHRALALRLLTGCVAIAVLFGASAYLTRYDVIGQDAVIHAINGVERLKARVRAIMPEPGTTLDEAIQRALDEEPAHPLVSRHGQFVFARFHAPDGTILAQRAEAGAPPPAQLAAFLARSPPRFPAADEPWSATADIGGRPHIHVALAVRDRSGTVAAYGEGLYALSDAAIQGARRAALGVAGYVVLIVLATSLLLYPVILTLTRRLASFSERLLAANLETVQVLGSAIAQRDSDTDAHNYRVTLYTAHLAEAAGLGADEIRALIKGAFLHDVGKIGIRDHILHKPGKLDDDEFSVMKTHVDHGLEIMQRSEWLADAADVIGAHHEKFDGSGYPNRLRGEQIPIAARIFAIADVFDALTSRRPYKEPFSFEESMHILEKGRGTHFDPALLDLFASLARDLHARYGGREDAGLRVELNAFVQRYFTAGLDSLVY